MKDNKYEFIQDENTDVINLWEPLEFKIDKDYEYVKQGKIFRFFSNILYYIIALPILKLVTKIVYDFKIEGKENLKNIDGGAVSVSNHVLILDCAMIGLAYKFKKVYYTTSVGSFKIPFVRKLIRLLRAIPIPKEITNKKEFIKQINDTVKNGGIVHFYPEAALWPYYNKLRKFKNGAFNFAIKNNVPVIPMVFTFRNSKGIRKIFKRKKDVTLTILPQISLSKDEEKGLNDKSKILKLKEKVFEEMKKVK